MKAIVAVAAILIMSFLAACAAFSNYQLPATHPRIFELGERREFCTKCHGFKTEPIDFERYNHTAQFTDTHRMVAYQDDRICALCHDQSFCSDCHGRVEMKPSLKDQTRNYSRMQHRGDYLSRHRIDGRMDPSSCFRCHGSPGTSGTCQPCHGNPR